MNLDILKLDIILNEGLRISRYLFSIRKSNKSNNKVSKLNNTLKWDIRMGFWHPNKKLNETWGKGIKYQRLGIC